MACFFFCWWSKKYMFHNLWERTLAELIKNKRASCNFKEINLTNQFILVIKRGNSFVDEQNVPYIELSDHL